ncbi:MAG: RNA polymerase sigma factor [Myxococcota bacterium]
MTPGELHTLYRTYGGAVRARCRAMCGNVADADEALQETFVKAWRFRERFDGRKPLAWLQTIARNACLDLLRRRRPWRDDPAVWLKLAAPEKGSAVDRVTATRLLDQFGSEDAALLRLRYAEEWRIAEIADHFDTSQRTIRRRLERLERRAAALLGLGLEGHHA